MLSKSKLRSAQKSMGCIYAHISFIRIDRCRLPTLPWMIYFPLHGMSLFSFSLLVFFG